MRSPLHSTSGSYFLHNQFKVFGLVAGTHIYSVDHWFKSIDYININEELSQRIFGISTKFVIRLLTKVIGFLLLT